MQAQAALVVPLQDLRAQQKMLGAQAAVATRTVQHKTLVVVVVAQAGRTAQAALV